MLFEDSINHAWLIVTGFSLAALSLIKFNSGNLGKERLLDLTGLKSQPFLIGGSMLGLSFLFSGSLFRIIGDSRSANSLKHACKKVAENYLIYSTGISTTFVAS